MQVDERGALAVEWRGTMSGTCVPSMAVAASAGGVIPGDETSVLIVVAILWAIAVAIAAFAYPVRHYRREHGIRQTGRQAS